MKQIRFDDLKVPLILVVLSLVPMLGGIARFHSMGGGVPVTDENVRFVASPFPIILHIVTATLYSIVGAFQFSRGIRIRWPKWHRNMGKVLVVSGFLVALTGLWMTVAYAIPGRLQGPILLLVRLVVGVAMVAALAIAWKKVLQRDFAAHEAWMIRAYALGQGAGMQVVLMLPLILITGEVLGGLRDFLMTLAWIVNLGIAEYAIRASQRKPLVVRPA